MALHVLKRVFNKMCPKLDTVSRTNVTRESSSLCHQKLFSVHFLFLCLYFLDNFVKILCNRISVLLKDKYESSMDINCDWLLHTANCGEDIQSSGTFRKAVNLRINSTITPLLSELIACLDRNGNLELALCNEEVPECLFNLWQDIFRDDRLFVLQYKDTVSPHTLLPRRRVPVLSDGAGGKYFKAHFPFSWLINQCASQVLSNIRSLIAGLQLNPLL